LAIASFGTRLLVKRKLLLGGMHCNSGALKLGTVPMIVVGGVSGGTGSVIGGGNFLDGFKLGLITSGLNHTAHAFYKTLTELEYSTATAKEMYKKVYGEIPSYTDIVADGTVPESFEKDGYIID